MIIAVVLVGLVASLALAVALGVSLGRNGDREDEYVYRSQVGEALNQLDQRLLAQEKDGPPPEEP
jgi:hypothetical protein